MVPLLGNLFPLHPIPKIRMTSIQSRKRLRRKRTLKDFSRFSTFLESTNNKPFFDSSIIDSIVGLFGLFIAKYIEENLQKIFKTVLKAQACHSDRFCKKQLKARLPNVYYGKFHIKYYNVY